MRCSLIYWFIIWRINIEHQLFKSIPGHVQYEMRQLVYSRQFDRLVGSTTVLEMTTEAGR